MYTSNYLVIIIILFLVFLISLVVFLLSLLIFYQNINEEKNSIYECGFITFGDARNKFEVKFYLVSILFIVFDLEIAFLLPCIAILYKLMFFGLAVLITFLVFIAAGFIYEWKVGAMSW